MPLLEAVAAEAVEDEADDAVVAEAEPDDMAACESASLDSVTKSCCAAERLPLFRSLPSF